MQRIFIVGLIFASLQASAQSSIDSYFNQKLSPAQLEIDYAIFRMGLEKIHPGLYRYNSKNHMDSVFLLLKQGLSDEMDLLDFYRRIAQVVAEIKCQHTVATPKKVILSKIEKEGKLLPFGTFWEFDPTAVYITYDFSSEGNLPPGTRILEINGKSIEDIYATLISYFPSDGYILSNKHSRLMYGLELHLWYYLLIDHPDTFVVKLETPQKNVIEKKYDAVTAKELAKNYNRYTSQKDPELRPYFDYWKNWNKKNTSKPIRLEFVNDSIALFTVGNFLSNKFKKLVDQAFKEINRRNIRNLIIDVRGNGGGSDIFGRYLFTYLIEKPTAYFDSLYTTTGIADTTFLFKHTDKDQEWYYSNLPLVYQLSDGRFATKPEINQGLRLLEPGDVPFKGDVYVLMNGRSASTTAEFTAATHFNNLATFIGEESGGAYHGGNGGDFAQLNLPNSEIQVQIPLSRYVMNSNESRFVGQGTIPNFEVTRSIEDVLKGRDPQLEYTIELIKSK